MPNTSGIIWSNSRGSGDASSLDGNSPMTGGGIPDVITGGGLPDGDSPMTGGSPAEAGGIQPGDSPMTGGSPTEPGGVQPGNSPMTGGSPTEPGGVQPGNSPMSGGTETEALMGNITGKSADGSERPAAGGLGAQANGTGFSERDNLDVMTDMPGLEITGDDVASPVGFEKARYKFRAAGEVEVARLTLTPGGGTPALQTVFTPTADQLRFLPTRILAFALDVTAVVTQPEIDLRKTVLGDVLAQVALGFTATGQGNEFPCIPNRQVILTAEDLQLGIPVSGAFGTYSIELSFLGRVIPS